MKSITCLLMVALSLAAHSTSAGDNDKESCVASLLSEISYTRPWKGATRQRFHKIEELNGVLIWETTDFFSRKRRLPTEVELIDRLRKTASTYGYQVPSRAALEKERSLPEEEQKTYQSVKKNLMVRTIIKGFKEYYKLEGSAQNFEQLLRIGVSEIASKELMVLKDKIALGLIQYFKARLRMPSVADLAEIVNMDKDLMLLVVGDTEEFVQHAIHTHQRDYLAAREKLIKAFVRAISQQDRPVYARTQRTTPKLEQVFEAMKRMKQYQELQDDATRGELSLPDLERLTSAPTKPVRKGTFPVPQLFKDFNQIEAEARIQHPAAFRNYFDTNRFSREKMDALIEAIVAAPGFLATTAVAGVPVDQDQLNVMLKLAEDRGLPIVVFPSLGVTEGLAPELLDNPRIHILTHTVSNSFLKLWNIPIGPKNQNPFASLDLPRQVEPGQLVVVGHPQLAFEIKPTGSNHVRETQLWSTGAITKNLYPYAHPMQGRTGGVAKNSHTMGALIFEKADRAAGALGQGATNTWHTRPIYFHDFREQGGEAFMVDLGDLYFIRPDGKVEKRNESPEAVEPGDIHEMVTHQDATRKLRDFIAENPGIRYVFANDLRDGTSHNHHEAKNLNLMMEKFRSGDLDIHREEMGVVQWLNGILAVRDNIHVVVKHSNHHVWLDNLLNLPPEAQMTINGVFLTELQHARRVLGYSSALDYLVHGRKAYLESLPPEVRARFENEAIFVSDADRVQVLKPGESFVLGPQYFPISHEHHGHQGNNGAKGSKRSHASGSPNANVGDSHTAVIKGGLMVAGTLTPKRQSYSMGGYSSWAIAWVAQWSNGARQLILYNNLTQTYRQRPGVGILKGEAFFADNPLRVQENDNDLLPGVSITDPHSQYLDRQRPPKDREGDKGPN